MALTRSSYNRTRYYRRRPTRPTVPRTAGPPVPSPIGTQGETSPVRQPYPGYKQQTRPIARTAPVLPAPAANQPRPRPGYRPVQRGTGALQAAGERYTAMTEQYRRGALAAQGGTPVAIVPGAPERIVPTEQLPLTPQQRTEAARYTAAALREGKAPSVMSQALAEQVGVEPTITGQTDAQKVAEAARYTGQALFGGFDVRALEAFEGAIDEEGNIVNPNLLPNMMSPSVAAALGVPEEARRLLYEDGPPYRLRAQATPPAITPRGTTRGGGYGRRGGYGFITRSPYFASRGGGGYGLVNWRIP